MKIYVLPPESIERAKRKALIRDLADVGFIVAVLILAFVGAGLIPVGIVVKGSPIILVVFGIALIVGLRIQDRDLKSYQLLVNLDSVVRKQSSLPDVEIHREQITRVEEKTGTGLIIGTADKESFIYVPEGLEGMNELKETLSAWRPSDSIISSKERGPLFRWGMFLSFELAFIILWRSTNLVLAIAAGMYMNIFMIWSLVLYRRQSVDPRAKISPELMVIGVLVCAIMLYARVTVLLKH